MNTSGVVPLHPSPYQELMDRQTDRRTHEYTGSLPLSAHTRAGSLPLSARMSKSYETTTQELNAWLRS